MHRVGIVAWGWCRLAVACVAMVLVSVALSACGPIGDGPVDGGPTGNDSAQAGLAGCPTLHPKEEDPVDGRNCVAALQQALHDRGYSNQVVDGRFGAATTANVVDFQKKHGLTHDGVVGQQTRNVLLSGGGGGGGGGGGSAKLVAGCAPRNPLGAACPIMGSGFAPGERVHVDYSLPNGNGQGVGATADGKGAFTARTVLPVEHTGTVSVEATGEQSDRSASTKFVQEGRAVAGPAEIHCVLAEPDDWSFTYAGSGFGPSEGLDVTFNPDSNDPQVRRIATQNDGTFQAISNFSVEPGKPLRLQAKGVTTGRVASTTIHRPGAGGKPSPC